MLRSPAALGTFHDAECGYIADALSVSRVMFPLTLIKLVTAGCTNFTTKTRNQSEQSGNNITHYLAQCAHVSVRMMWGANTSEFIKFSSLRQMVLM